MTDEYCGDCFHIFEKGQMRIYYKGEVRCEKCDRIFNEKQEQNG